MRQKKGEDDEENNYCINLLEIIIQNTIIY